MLTTRQVAARLGVTPRQVRRYVAAGLLDATPVGDYSTAPLVVTEASVLHFEQQRDQQHRDRITKTKKGSHV